MYPLIFIAALLYVAISFGSFAVSNPKMFPVPAAARFLAGFSLAPHLIGATVLMSFATVPGIPWWAIHGIVLGLATLLLVASRKSWLLRRRLRVGFGVVSRDLLKFLPIAAMGLMLAYLFDIFYTNARAPLLAFDALQYAREALRLGAFRDMSAWVGQAGTADGTFRGDIHHPIYVAYLSWSQRFAPDASVFHDAAMRVAFQATMLAMLSSLPVIGLALRWRWWSFAAIPLLLLVPQFDYVSSNASRDAFRIVPIVLLLALLLRLGWLRLSRHCACEAVAPIVLLAMFCLMSHTLNGVVVVCLGTGWFLWVSAKGSWTGGTIVAFGGALGLLLGSWTYVDAFLHSGSVHGQGVTMYGVLAGTPMLDLIRSLDQSAAGGIATPTGRIVEAVTRDGRGIALVAALVSVVIMAWAVRDWRSRIKSPIVGAAIIAIVVAAPVLGVFDIAGNEVSQWFVTNTRYALHWYIFMVVVIMAPLSAIVRERSASRLATNSLHGLIAALCIMATFWTLTGWYRNTWSAQYVDETLANIRTAEGLIGDRRLVIEDARWNYYLEEKLVVMYSLPTRSLFTAKSDPEIETALRDLNLAGMVLSLSSIDRWWKYSPIYAYMSGHACGLRLPEKDQILFVVENLVPAGTCASLEQAAEARRDNAS